VDKEHQLVLAKISKADTLKTSDPILMILFLLRFNQYMIQHISKLPLFEI